MRKFNKKLKLVAEERAGSKILRRVFQRLTHGLETHVTTFTLRIALLVAILGCLLSPALTIAQATRPSTRKVVLIAGVKSHGPVGNGIHDYGWSVRFLHAVLERSDAKDQLRIEHHLDGWPRDPAVVEDADCLVVISDGRDGDKFSEALHLESKERIALVDRLMKRGCGLVLIHFSNFAPQAYADSILNWTGGYYQWETDGKKKWYSNMKVLETEVKPADIVHPILRGVKPFREKEEFYFNLRFATGAGAPTPLLTVPALQGREPDGNVVAWAKEREGGGRAFCTTGGHFYANWATDDFRKTVLNGIVWSAHAEVPKSGVESKFIAREELK